MPEFTPVTTDEITPGKPVGGLGGFGEKAKDNFDYLNGQIGSLGLADIPNGSFDIDSDADSVPDGWTRNLYAGGSGGRISTTQAHGSACVNLVHPGGGGNGGGYYESGYVPCSPQMPEIVSLVHWATAAGMHNQVVAQFYDADLVTIGADQTLYDSTANPAAATLLLLGFVPPAAARHYKLQLVGGKNDVDVAGTAYFDRVARQSPGRALDLVYAPCSEGTIAEQTETTQQEWIDNGAFVVSLPVRGLPVVLAFSAELKNSDGATTAKQRFRIGAGYSNEAETTSSAYVAKTYTISLSSAETGGGDLTVTMQLWIGVITQTAYGRKITTDATVKYDRDGE